MYADVSLGVVMGVALLAGCRGSKVVIPLPDIPARDLKPAQDAAVLVPVPGRFVGFDRNDYPGDDRLAELHKSFSFAGYWLTTPPGETANSWVGKRAALRAAGFGFLVLANGKLEKEILAAGGASISSAGALGKADADAAVAAARREGFPKGTIMFLDQEEGGRLTDAQAAYFFGWTEAVAATEYKAGAYVSGEPVPDGPGKTTSTAAAIRETIANSRAGADKSKREFANLHDVALWVYEDSCPPAPGCLIAGGTGPGRKWNHGRFGVAVCAVAAAAGFDEELCEDLCGGRDVLRGGNQGYFCGPERGGRGGSFGRAVSRLAGACRQGGCGTLAGM